MKNIKRLLAATVICLPLSAWADFAHWPNPDQDTLVFIDTPVGGFENVEMAITNTGTTPIEGILVSVRGDFIASYNCGGVLHPGGVCGIPATFVPTHPGKHVKNVTIDGYRVNSDGTVDSLTISFRLEGRAIK